MQNMQSFSEGFVGIGLILVKNGLHCTGFGWDWGYQCYKNLEVMTRMRMSLQ